MAERVQEPRARDRGGRRRRDRLHILKAILRPCPTGFAWPASRCRVGPTRPRTSSAPSSSSRAPPRPARTSSSCRRSGTRSAASRRCTRRPSRSRAASRSRAIADWARPAPVTLVGGSITERREGREKLSNTCVVLDPDGRARRRLPQDPPLRRRGRRQGLPRVGGRGARRRGRRRAGRGLAGRADGLLRPPLPGALPRARARGRRARDRPVELHARAPGRDHWHVLLRARAIENQVFVAAAAQVGEMRPGRPSYGRSLVADPWGIVLCEAPDEETVVTAELDRARLRRIRARPALAREPPPGGVRAPRAAVSLRAVLFDVDFTLARPGPELGPEGYRRLGERFGLELDPSRYDEARERGGRAAPPPPGARPRRGGLGRLHRGDRARHGRRRRAGARGGRGDDPRLGARAQLRALRRRRCRRSPRCASTASKLGLVSNTGARPRRVRRAPPARRRRAALVRRPRQDEAAPDDLPRRARAPRRSSRRRR